GLLFFMLAFGPNTPVFRLYRLLPFGRLFSEPQKFLWVTDFCLAVLAGLGTQAIAVEAGSRKRLLAAVAAAAGVRALARLAASGLDPRERLLGMVVTATPIAAGGRRPAAMVLLLATIANLVGAPSNPLQALLPGDAALYPEPPLLNDLRGRMTP